MRILSWVAHIFLLVGALFGGLIIVIVLRFNPHWGVWLIIQWIKLLQSKSFQKVSQGHNSVKNQALLDFWTLIALLHQGAPWEQVKSVIERYNSKDDMAPSVELAFYTYFVDEKYESAEEVALLWCKVTEEQVHGHEEDMRLFFAWWGTTDTSPQARNRIMNTARRERAEAWKADPQGPPHPNSLAGGMEYYARIRPYIRYCRAHLAFEIVRWMRKQDSEKRRQAKAELRVEHPTRVGRLPEFQVNEAVARSMGMDEATLGEALKRATGS